MAQDALIQLKKLATLSEEMLQQAEQGEWENVQQMELQRQSLLPDFSNTLLNQQQHALVSTTLERIVHINSLIANLCTSERDNQRNENRKVATGKRAVNAYNGAV